MAWLLRRSVFLPWELGSLLGTDRAVAALEDLRIEGVSIEGGHPSRPGH